MDESKKSIKTSKTNIDINFTYTLLILFRCRKIVYPAVISISLGISCITAVLNIGQAMKNNIIASFSLNNNTVEAYFTNNNEFAINHFNETQIRKISTLTNHNAIGESSSTNAVIDNHFVSILGINDHYYIQKFGKNIYSILMSGDSKVAIIPNTLNSLIKEDKNSDRYIKINDLNLIVIKEYDGNDDSPILVPIKTLKKITNSNIEKLSFTHDNPEKTAELYQKIKTSMSTVFGSLSEGITVKFSRDTIKALTKNITEIQNYLLAISMIIMVVATINVNNTLNRLINLRKLEFGIRLAYGETKSNIMLSLLLETFLICQIGVALGAVFYLFISLVMFYLAPNLNFTFYTKYFMYSISIGVISALFSAITPSSKVMKLSVIKILKDL